MKRKNWEFELPASALLDAAKKKFDTHTERLTFWKGIQEKTMAKVRESGIKVQESAAASYSNTTAAFGPQVVVDATLQRDLTESQRKITEHMSAAQEYDGWVQVLKANQGRTYSLNADDYLYFFGTGNSQHAGDDDVRDLLADR